MKYFCYIIYTIPIVSFLILASMPQYAQDQLVPDQLVPDRSAITIVDELSKKSNATIGDAVVIFTLITGNTPEAFDSDIVNLRNNGLLDDRFYKESELLKRGDLAFMTARLLKLDDSLMYKIFGTRRYALTACRAAGLFPGEGGENGVISGGELIDVMILLSEDRGGEE